MQNTQVSKIQLHQDLLATLWKKEGSEQQGLCILSILETSKYIHKDH